MKKKYPKIVTKLTTLCDAWIIGSAVVEENPRDYDVFVPIDKWLEASNYIPQNAKINRLGGFKMVCEGKEIDVWTGKMEFILTTNQFKFAFHPKSGIKISREKVDIQ